MLKEKISNGTALIGIIGLGYVGLPLGLTFLQKGFKVKGFDVDKGKVRNINEGRSYLENIKDESIANYREKGLLEATEDFSLLKDVDVIIICVPTPLNKTREPDLSYVISTTKTVAKSLRKGHLVVLESTTYPETTEEEILPILEETGLKVGEDFYLGYSPEREDPGNVDFSTSTVPKIVSGVTPKCLEVTKLLYDRVVVKTVPVSSPRVAESAKLLENIYRAVNIAMVNELKMLFDRMGIDIWEVIDAAKTKPFGFQAFYPGPGLGGHCIPVDPFYLTWKAREYDFHTRFIELAGEVNVYMPYYVVQKTMEALNRQGKSIKGAKVLVLGIAYKKDVDDMRESPALKLIELLKEKEADVSYNDPHIQKIPKTRHYDLGLTSVELTEETLEEFDCIVVATNHSSYDYSWIRDHSSLIVDTRNAFGEVGSDGKVVKS
jgi:UDP-N-acetyl-D-glucosamine dehydrogenase